MFIVKKDLQINAILSVKHQHFYDAKQSEIKKGKDMLIDFIFLQQFFNDSQKF